MIGDKIRAIRLKKGISQEHLAEQLSISQPTLGRIEQGKAKLDAELLPMLCIALSVEMKEFYCVEKNNLSESSLLDLHVSDIFQSIENLKSSIDSEVQQLKSEISQLQKRKKGNSD
jgi:transcriptional regulator with XRE-family HTH domain